MKITRMLKKHNAHSKFILTLNERKIILFFLEKLCFIKQIKNCALLIKKLFKCDAFPLLLIHQQQ
jgi:hypothetical protein